MRLWFSLKFLQFPSLFESSFVVSLRHYFPLYFPYIPLYSLQHYYKMITGKPLWFVHTATRARIVRVKRVILGCVHQVLMNQTIPLGQQQGILITTSTHFERKYQLSLLTAVIMTPLRLP